MSRLARRHLTVSESVDVDVDIDLTDHLDAIIELVAADPELTAKVLGEASNPLISEPVIIESIERLDSMARTQLAEQLHRHFPETFTQPPWVR